MDQVMAENQGFLGNIMKMYITPQNVSTSYEG